jgi:site-specific recombinase XerD
MPKDSFPVLLRQFFAHLRATQEASPHTIAAYRDTLKLLLHFIAKERRLSIDRITFEAFCPETILPFLEHLQKERHNTSRTRNARLAAIRTFVRFCLPEVAPDFVDQAQRILAIPCKRTDKPLLGFLSRQEVEAILAAADLANWTGRRDHLLFSLLYNTGARISEALQVTPADLQNRVVRLRGKGRKQREVPLWSQTWREFQQWCRDNQIGPSQPLFGNREGKSLSRREAARRLALTLQKASLACPSLRNRDITLHSWRHTCAMHLLQAGVAIEIIALWLGHEQLSTTHGYLEADLNMKKETLAHLQAPSSAPRVPKKASSNVLAFLEAL